MLFLVTIYLLHNGPASSFFLRA